MFKKTPVSLGTLNTILNTAPLIIQGATKLVKMIKDREKPEPTKPTTPDTLEGLKDEIKQVNSRLDENYESDIQQIKLIEELAKQNELLATALQKAGKQINIIRVIAVCSLLISLLLLIKVFSS